MERRIKQSRVCFDHLFASPYDECDRRKRMSSPSIVNRVPFSNQNLLMRVAMLVVTACPLVAR